MLIDVVFIMKYHLEDVAKNPHPDYLFDVS